MSTRRHLAQESQFKLKKVSLCVHFWYFHQDLQLKWFYNLQMSFSRYILVQSFWFVTLFIPGFRAREDSNSSTFSHVFNLCPKKRVRSQGTWNFKYSKYSPKVSYYDNNSEDNDSFQMNMKRKITVTTVLL